MKKYSKTSYAYTWLNINNTVLLVSIKNIVYYVYSLTRRFFRAPGP